MMDSCDSIMIIEDEEIEREYIELVFRDSSINNELIFMNDGRKAWDYLKSYEELPGLIIADISMPNLSGIDLLYRVKSDKVLKIIPYIILTTSRHKLDIETCYKNGAAGYFVKCDDFFSTIKTIHDYWKSSENYPMEYDIEEE